MTYTAVHYVKVAGRSYTPGEIFTANMTAAEEERMLRLGAIISNGPAYASKHDPETHDEPEDEQGNQQDDPVTDDAEQIPAIIDAMDAVVTKPKRGRKK